MATGGLLMAEGRAPDMADDLAHTSSDGISVSHPVVHRTALTVPARYKASCRNRGSRSNSVAADNSENQLCECAATATVARQAPQLPQQW